MRSRVLNDIVAVLCLLAGAVVFLPAGSCAAQSLQVLQQKPEPATLTLELEYVADPDFVPEACYWHIWLEGGDSRKPFSVEGCHSIEHTFPAGKHQVDLVINGRQRKYSHLSLEQRTLHRILIVQPRIVVKVLGDDVE